MTDQDSQLSLNFNSTEVIVTNEVVVLSPADIIIKNSTLDFDKKIGRKDFWVLTVIYISANQILIQILPLISIPTNDLGEVARSVTV